MTEFYLVLLESLLMAAGLDLQTLVHGTVSSLLNATLLETLLVQCCFLKPLPQTEPFWFFLSAVASWAVCLV